MRIFSYSEATKAYADKRRDRRVRCSCQPRVPMPELRESCRCHDGRAHGVRVSQDAYVSGLQVGVH